MTHKLIIVIITTLLLFSCSETPKCGDDKIKEIAVIEFKKDIKPIILKYRIEDSINYNDIREYANDHELDYKVVLNAVKEKLTKELEPEVDEDLESTELKNIITEKIENDINKCNCSADIENVNLKPIEIYYTAQKADESEDGVIVKISYKLKETPDE